MGVKQNITRGLKKNAIYGYCATFGLFTAGFVTGMTHDYLSSGMSEKAQDFLVTATNTMMCGGLLTGVFMAASAILVKAKFEDEALQEARDERLEAWRHGKSLPPQKKL